MRKQKRKSADLELDSAARAVISLTASSHASIPDGPRCSLSLFMLHFLPHTYVCIGKNRPQRLRIEIALPRFEDSCGMQGCCGCSKHWQHSAAMASTAAVA